MKIVADEAATRHINEHGGRAWVWLERHPFPGEDVPPPDEWGGEVPGRHGRA